MKLFLAAIFVLTTAAAASLAQDPAKVAPEAYKLQFENEWVKVLRVHYGAHSKTAIHEHPAQLALFVYLNDAGPVTFLHTGDGGRLQRPAVKARMFRLSPAVSAPETHSVENTGDTSSDAVRIDFKTEQKYSNMIVTRYDPARYDPSVPYSSKTLDNERLAVTRMATPRGTAIDITAFPRMLNWPCLIVLLTKGRSNGKDLAVGQTIWLPSGETIKLQAPDKSELEILRIDIKTPPEKAR